LPTLIFRLGARSQARIIQSDVLFRQHLDKLALAMRDKLPALFSAPAFPNRRADELWFELPARQSLPISLEAV
jgi:hypothetical protein